MAGTRLTVELLMLLQTPGGKGLLHGAAALADDPFAAQRLRERAQGFPDPEGMAAAAVEQVRLRLRARAKFSQAAEMWFVGSLLEQASGELVAAHRARRFERCGFGDRELGDFCCGLGSDAFELARHSPVTAVDRDPLAAALTRANAAVLGCSERVRVMEGEIPDDAPPVAAAWVDPGRREGGQRTRSLEGMSPSLAAVLGLRDRIPHLGVKLSPASRDSELDAALAGTAHEREFLSSHGECRELAVWTGDLAGRDPGQPGPLHRATVLPSGETLCGVPVPFEPVRLLGAYLYEPDPAVIRSGLTPLLAASWGAWFIDPKLAYLSHDRVLATSLAQGYRVRGREPFSGKVLAERLRQMEAGDVALKTRGAAVEPETLRRQLRRVLKLGRPDRCPVVFVTRLSGCATMILGERLGAGIE